MFETGGGWKICCPFCFINMITVEPISTPQTISVYVRKDAGLYDVIITDEQTDVETIFESVFGTYMDGILTFDIEYPFVESRFYWMHIKENVNGDYISRVITDGGVVESPECIKSGDAGTGINVNKSKIFATTQTDYQTYSMSDGYFDEIKKTKPRFYVKD